ncbi:MAG: hypothetical protein L3J30_01600 [Marinosulfonomonas sp.]|nr:hypothetical protein [Marinosulfonomonas sp.]
MATPDQIPTDLTIDLGDDLAPDEFIVAVRNFLGYVSEITDSQKGDGADVSWTVKVSEGSALVGVYPNETAPASRLAMIYKQAEYGPTALARGDIKGAGLSEKAIGHLKSLSDLVGKHQNGKGVNLWVNRKPISIGSGIAKIVREDWESDYHDFGTIEGRLEAIQDSSGSIKIRVKDFLYPRAINCVVPERMIEQVLTSFRKRVEIEGRIHYRRDGTPISIEADHIDLLPEDSDLPSAADVRGIMVSA